MNSNVVGPLAPCLSSKFQNVQIVSKYNTHKNTNLMTPILKILTLKILNLKPKFITIIIMGG